MHELVDVADGRLGERPVQDPHTLVRADNVRRVAGHLVVVARVDLQHNVGVAIPVKHLGERNRRRRLGSIHQYHVCEFGHVLAVLDTCGVRLDCAEIRRWAAVEVVVPRTTGVIGDALESAHHFEAGEVDMVDVGTEKHHGTHQELGDL